MATPAGSEPTGTVATTAFVEVLITETVPALKLVTYALLPSGVTATANGPEPTGTVATTVLLAVSITETELEPKLAT